MKMKIKVDLPQETKEFLDRKWTPDDSVRLLQIAEDEMSLFNFREIWRTFQGAWWPLSRGYMLWKRKHYPGKLKWDLTGETLKAMLYPAKLSVTGGTQGAKKIKVTQAASLGKIVAEYEYGPPAAGGYFEKNNNRRPFWFLLPKYREKIQKRIYEMLASVMKRGGF